MGYENAPATRMLATHCAACGRPLVDAKSVEMGIGPDCRKRLGYERSDITEETRTAANRLVYEIALDQGCTIDTLHAAEELRVLGFEALADKVVANNATVRIAAHPDGGAFTVTAPFNGASLGAWRAIRGQRWDGAAKVRVVPDSERSPVYQLLRTYYPGALAYGPKGPFKL